MNKSDLQYQSKFCKELWKSFPMMVLDAKIDEEMKKTYEAEAETKASKVKERFLGNSVELDSTLSYS